MFEIVMVVLLLILMYMIYSAKWELKQDIRALVANLDGLEKPVLPQAAIDEVAPKTETKVPRKEEAFSVLHEDNLKTVLKSEKQIAAEKFVSPQIAPKDVEEIETTLPRNEVPVLHREPSAAMKLLRKMWNWIVFGQESVPENREFAIATTWLMRVGVVALVLCIGYFLRWSINHQLIGLTGRIAVSLLASASMLVLGNMLLSRRYQIIGQGLLGGGIAGLYFSVFAAGIWYEKISLTLAFVLMGLVTVFSGALSVKKDSLLVAVIGLLGGFLTPVLLKSDTPNLLVLYGYIAVLNLGIVGVSHLRNWHLVNIPSLYLTYILIWISSPSPESSLVWAELALVTFSFVLHTLLSYSYNVRKKIPTTGLEIAHLIVNSVIYSLTALTLIPSDYEALVAVGLSAYFAGHAFVFFKEKYSDRKLAVTSVALGSVFAIWTLPLLFEKTTLTVFWSLQALAFFWISRRLGSRLLRTISYALYAVVAFRIGLFEFPKAFGVQGAVALGTYFSGLLDRLINFLVPILAFFGAFVFQPGTNSQDALISEENDWGPSVSKRQHTATFLVLGIAGAFFFLLLEAHMFFERFAGFSQPTLTCVFVLLAVVLWAIGQKEGYKGFLVAAFGGSFLATMKLFSDASVWQLDYPGVYQAAYSSEIVFGRLLDFGAVLFLFAMFWYVSLHDEKGVGQRLVMGLAAVALLFVLLTLELNTALSLFAPSFQSGAISVLWSSFAFAFLLSGVVKNNTLPRHIGLVLFLIVGIKVIFSDLSGMDMLVRVVAFFVIGLIFIAGSWSYLRFGEKRQLTNES